jgi:hypothetical protein
VVNGIHQLQYPAFVDFAPFSHFLFDSWLQELVMLQTVLTFRAIDIEGNM